MTPSAFASLALFVKNNWLFVFHMGKTIDHLLYFFHLELVWLPLFETGIKEFIYDSNNYLFGCHINWLWNLFEIP
jgi:hypothetical protein